jgi:glutamine synthetase
MSSNLKSSEDILRMIKDDKIGRIDLRFTDLPGHWHRVSLPSSSLNVENLTSGIEFDRQLAHDSLEDDENGGLLLLPDPSSAFLDPFAEQPTLVLICNVLSQAAGRDRDPRLIAQKAEAYMRAIDFGDTANFGPELHHFVFLPTQSHQSIKYPAAELLERVRALTVTILEKIGVGFDVDHMRFAPLTRMADNVMIYKYVIENVARQHALAATLMPKPLFKDGLSGMRIHQSIWNKGRNLFAGQGYQDASAQMRHYFAGLLEHTPVLLAICAPAASGHYKALAGKATASSGRSRRERSAVCRIPAYSPDPKLKRVEFCSPDPSCNPYLAFAAMLMAGIDGFLERLYNVDPSKPLESLYDLPSLAESSSAPSPPGGDYSFLLKGDVFTRDAVEAHLRRKGPRGENA